ncbi:MAG: chromate transporter [Hyphomicrobiaceae bacterium]
MQLPNSGSTDGAETTPHAPLATIYWIFFQIGALSFGGGLSAWTYLEVVDRRKLLKPGDFLGGLTLAQVLPGINMANLSIYTGQRLRGIPGALAAFFGLISVPFFAIIIFASIYSWLIAVPFMQAFLDGLAASAVGLLLAMGVKASRSGRMELFQFAVMGIVVITVGILRWPMIPVILIMAPLSVILAWRRGASSNDEANG